MRRAVLWLLVTLGSGVTPLAGLAQPRHSIYVQYDGFVRAEDNQLVLAFGYFNLNQVAVTIDVGEANGFRPGTADRQQPTVFRSGRRRFACVMVAPEPFDGILQWHVVFSGHSSTTTARVLDPLYALEEDSARRVLDRLDGATVSTGMCVEDPRP